MSNLSRVDKNNVHIVCEISVLKDVITYIKGDDSKNIYSLENDWDNILFYKKYVLLLTSSVFKMLGRLILNKKIQKFTKCEFIFSFSGIHKMKFIWVFNLVTLPY